MQEAQIVSRNLDESVWIPGSSSEHKSSKDLPRIDILKEPNEENELKSTPRLRLQLLQEDDIISDKLAVSPLQTISSRTPSPSFMAKRLIVNTSRISQKDDPSKTRLFRQGSIENLLRSPAKSPKGFFRKASENDRHLTSGAKKISRLRSKEIPEDSHVDTAELYDIQYLFHNYESPSANNKCLQSNSGVRAKKHQFTNLSEIQEAYYNTLRKKMVRRKSQKLEEPVEFSEQIKEIKGSVRTPNDMRSRDIVIIDKTNMERTINYHDKYPLLGLRKRVLKFLQWISILCYKIVTLPAFDYAILAVVLTNSILLAMDDPTDNKAAISPGLDNGLLAVYTTEMVLKILGMGFFFGKKAYLKDYWNILDFIIVTTAYIPLIVTSSSVNLQGIRVLRVLRPLRTISKIKALKVVMLTLLAAIRPLMETVFILIFMFAIFAIAGLQLFGGILKKRCFAFDTGIASIDPHGDSDINYQIFCSTDNDCYDYGGQLHICGKMIANPIYGITNFDNLLSSLLMVYQTVTMEGWSATMYDVQKTFSPFTAIYFLVVIIMCAYFLLNLTLAIIKAEFTSKSTDADKGRLDRKFRSYDVKLAEKLESKKGDVLKLIKRRENGEIQYDRYIFRKENLVALNAKKRHTKGFVPRRRRGTLGSITDKFTELGRIKLGERVKEGFLTVFSRMKTSYKNVAIHPSPEVRPKSDEAMSLQNKLSARDQEEDALKSPKMLDDLSSSPHFSKKQEEANGAVSFDGSKANSFIVEAIEQQSIKTPTEASAQSLSDPQFARRRKIGKRTSKSPIRPVISQKIQVTPEGKRALIGMAGIRNKEEGKRLQIKKSASGLELLSLDEKTERNEISVSEDRSFLDHPAGRHFTFSPPKGAENDDVVISKNLVRKINKIKKLEKEINKSRASSNRKKSELLLSIFDLGEEVNYRQNEIEANIPSGILNDSDFFNDRQRYEMLRRKKANKQYKQKRGFSNGELLSPTAKKRVRNIEKAEDLLSPGERTSLDTTQVDETHYESEEEDKERYVINLRHLKTSAAFNKEYKTLSMDDVLPSERERQINKQEQEVIRQLRETRLPMKFRITQYDKARTIAQTTTRYTQSMTAASVAFQSNLKIQKIRRHKLEVKTFEENLSKKTSGSTARTSLKKSITKHKKKWHVNFLRPGDEENYLPPGKENDFFEVLKMMNKPFKNEDEFEDPETNQKKLKEFKFDEEYNNCRKKDLKNNKVGSNNWSGLSVLSKNGGNFAIERVKMAFNHQDFDIWRKGVMGVLHAGRRKVGVLIETSFFNNTILISVFLNTIILASQNLVTSTSGTNLLNTFNLIFTIIFTVELGLKLIALGPKGYAKDPMNIFDCLIVILSLFDQISTASSGSSSSGSGGQKAASAFRTVRLFRTFRVLRVTRLLRSLSYMKVIIGVVSRSLKKCVWVLVLLLLFLFIFSLLGMQVYGGKLSSSADQGGLREDFNSFFNAFLSAFQLITQENWNDFMTISIRSPEINTYISLLYLISWMCLGSYVFLNLFLAILLDEFTGEETEEELDEIEEENEEEEESIGGRTSSKTTVAGRTSSRTTVGGLESTKRGTTQKSLSIQSFDSKLSLEDASEDEKSSAQKVHQHHQVITCRKSLYIFSKRNWIRSACLWIIRHKYFERAILIMIAISSIKLSVDTFVSSSNDTYTNISDILDKVINIFFTVEAVTKIVSLGFFMDDGSYARDSWNLLDFSIVVVSLIDMSFSNLNIPVIKVLRLLRTLRPLRVISHNPSMRLIVTALLESLKPLLNVVIVISLVWLMFAILAVNIVGLKLGYCNMNDPDTSYYGISESQCPQHGVWTNPDVNFDNVGTAMVSLFIMSTEENWPTLMFSVADADDASSGPHENGNKLFAGFYFMIYLFLSSFFLLDLFAGVIFLEFTRAEKRENKMQKFLTSTQQQWVIMQRLVVTVKADLSNVEPEAVWMKKFFRIIHHRYFDMGIMCVIVLNILSMCLDYDDCSDGYSNALQTANYVFSVVFAVELVLKHLGLGYRRYWASNWNKFDAFVVLASILDLVMNLLQQSFLSFLKVGPQIARIFRVLRVTRLFKLIKQFQGLQKLINTLLFSLPSLLNVGALLFLVFYIYSVLGNFLFKDVATGNVIGDLVNFKNAAIAFITLFRCSTGENWYIIMFDTIYPTACVDGVNSCSTSAAAALPYWISFIVIAQYIFLNLFILVILQQFEEYHLNPDNPVNRFRETMEDKFVPTWEKYSLKHGGAHIHENQLLNFFMMMQQPIGFKSSNIPKKEIAKEVMRMNLIPDPYKMLFYNDVIFAAFKHGFNSESISEFTQYQYLLKEEMKSRKKLDGLRQIAIGHKARNAQMQRRGSVKPVIVNPIEKILFMGLMMKIWKNYAKTTFAKMQAAKKNGVDYVFSDSEEEEESQQIESESEDSYDDRDDDSYESQEEGYFESQSPAHHDLIKEEEEEEDQEEPLSHNDKGESELIMDEEREMLSSLQGKMADGNLGSFQNLSLSLKPPQTRSRRSLSPFIDPTGITAEKNRSLSTLPPPKIFMHNTDGEIHDITPKVSGLAEKSFAYHANPDSKSFNND